MTRRNDDLKPWEKQPGEPSLSHHGLTHYMHLGKNRSVRAAYEAHMIVCRKLTPVNRGWTPPTRWADLCAKWGWVDRSQAWDREQDRLALEKIAKDQIDARVRHARLAQATLQALAVPARATLESLQNPETLAKLVTQAQASPRAFLKLVELVSWASKSMPGVVNVERLALGMTTDHVQVDTVDRFGLEIADDPETRELAMALLTKLATKEQSYDDLP